MHHLEMSEILTTYLSISTIEHSKTFLSKWVGLRIVRIVTVIHNTLSKKFRVFKYIAFD